MSIISILSTLILGPLKLLFEFIYQIANRIVDHPGLSIIVLSLVMNILVLPLYRRADAMQEEARDTDAKLSRGISHIKQTFSGDEKMMILSTYYRQNNYKPTNALAGSVSLLLEVPFFMAAYQFLSHLEILNGVSLGPIKDLASPDALITVGGFTINLLPVLMTLINVVSSAIYLKGFPLKTKIQLYGMAAFFLVFLYTSPAGLVFYWTLNNLFSLLKNVFYKIKDPAGTLRALCTILGLASTSYGIRRHLLNLDHVFIFILLGILFLMPIVLHTLKSKLKLKRTIGLPEPNKKTFTLGCLFLTVLMGLLIPSTFISASPQEYVDLSYFHNPLWYIVSSCSMAAGFFLVWLCVFYWLASKKAKVILDYAVWILSGVCIVNYMFFGTDLGIISSSLVYNDGMSFTSNEQIKNLLVILIVAEFGIVIAYRWAKIIPPLLLTATVALSAMSGINVVSTARSINSISTEQSTTVPNFNLSKDGKNVVIIMLDRALGSMFPYFAAEKPELLDQYAGFTCYTNVLSYGGHTNFAAPSLFGGYEYTPVELNRRDGESLVSKHNEALLLMPVLFDDNGFDVTVCDPIYANYQWLSDTSIFDDYPDIDAFVTEGAFTDSTIKEISIENNHRNFFCFSLMKCMPLKLQPVIYNDGAYNKAEVKYEQQVFDVQKIVVGSTSIGYGASGAFVNCYYALENLPNITHVKNSSENTFLIFNNNATHEPTLLSRPEYEPKEYFDNTLLDAETGEKITVADRTLTASTYSQKGHYHSNMAVMLKIGEWLEHLKTKGVYDNTRIIITSDHGYACGHFEEFTTTSEDLQYYHPLLMVKDFNSRQFTYSDEFMTNADVVSIATSGVIDNPTNPFTGNPITTDEKYAHDQYVIMSRYWSTDTNNGNTFLPSYWAKVSSDIWNPENWSFYKKDTVLKEHTFPIQ